MKFTLLTQPVGWSKPMFDVFCAICVQERESYLDDIMKYTFNIS